MQSIIPLLVLISIIVAAEGTIAVNPAPDVGISEIPKADAAFAEKSSLVTEKSTETTPKGIEKSTETTPKGIEKSTETVIEKTSTETTITESTASGVEETTEETEIIVEENDEDLGDKYDYTKKVVQIYQIIQGKNYYLDCSGQNVALYDTETPKSSLNLILYELEKIHSDEPDDQIVIRHEQSLYYFCLNHCGKYYMTPTLTRDCLFIKSPVDDEDNVEIIHLQKLFNPITVTINVEFGQINFKKDAVLYIKTLDKLLNAPLTNLLDQADAEVCTGEYDIQIINGVEEETDANFALNSAGVHLSIVIVCITVVFVITTALFIIAICIHKRKNH
ncbi:fibroblast growth factor 3 [Epinotia aporema granulovirus]|uniref:Fibroblast growth factor 3 n=1 Tax=Epinotia aporema granulovirus TaxID=166056 RepID=K4EQU7_9BBAC|nr:fibroblast growth factor 3 [Epinotia aporema granulovirus]AER41556.1 fibroblast growth factor 3 [Epinotia aporema granulovirus]